MMMMMMKKQKTHAPTQRQSESVISLYKTKRFLFSTCKQMIEYYYYEYYYYI